MRARRSILRQAVGGALLLELLAAALLIALTAAHERRVRYGAFEAHLEGKAAALFGAVGEADDESDGVMLDARGVEVGPGEFYEVREQGGAKDSFGRGANVLGRGGEWPVAAVGAAGAGVVRDGRGRVYRVRSLIGVRVVDPGEPGGGKAHRVLVLYGAPLAPVEAEVAEVVRFQALASAAVLLLTAGLLAWLLRRALDPLRELAEAAERLSARDWRFEAPLSAARTRELLPLSAALEASVGRLRRSFEQQRRLTGDAAHELKTDVAIIKSSLQLLTLRERTAAGYREGLHRALEDCERIEATVSAMLTLARVEHAPDGAAGGADLFVAARDAARALAPLAEVQGVRVRLDGQEGAPVRLTEKDAGLLCTNLVENAIRHSPPGGEVVAAVARLGGAWTLAVEDRGEGIAAAVLPHIFEAFYRGDEARDRKHGGAGLGLAIAKAVCARAGGTLAAERRQGGGTRLLARLPMADRLPAPRLVETEDPYRGQEVVNE